jgi:hypothetical protein
MAMTEHLDAILAELATMSDDARIEALNEIRVRLHEVSPMRGEPVDLVLWVKQSEVVANGYNPNTVAPPEMKLLEHSIKEDGYTQPVVAFRRDDGTFEVVDGFHRNRVGRESTDVHIKVRGRLPVTSINGTRVEIKDRMASTIRHNRARGVHGVTPMAEIVSQMYFNGWSNARIARELGMDKDEVLRLKQVTGLGSLFENREFSSAWDLVDLEGRDLSA